MICKSLDELQEVLREKLKETQSGAGSVRSVSRETGISSSHLNNFKEGNRNFSFENLDKLATYYSVKYTLKNH